MGIFSRIFRHDSDDLENMYLCRETPYECLKPFTNLFPGSGTLELVPAVRIKPYYKSKIFLLVLGILMLLLLIIFLFGNVLHYFWNLFFWLKFLFAFLFLVTYISVVVWTLHYAHHIKFYPERIAVYSGTSPMTGHWRSFLCGIKHDIVKRRCGTEKIKSSVTIDGVKCEKTFRRALYDVSIDGHSIASYIYQKDADRLLKYLKFYLKGDTEPIPKSHQISYHDNSETLSKSHQISYQSLDKQKADSVLEKYSQGDKKAISSLKDHL